MKSLKVPKPIPEALIDSNVLRYNGTSRDALVDKVLRLAEDFEVILIVPHTVAHELKHPNTPEKARIIIIPCLLTCET